MRIRPFLPAVPLGVELAGLHLAADPRRVRQVVDVAVEHQHGPPQAVAVFHHKKRWILAVFLHRPLGLVGNGRAGGLR